MTQLALFDATAPVKQALAGVSSDMPSAPLLSPHFDWPYPGMTPEDSARAAIARSEAYHAMLAAVIKSMGGTRLTTSQVLASVPDDWRDLCGKYAHADLPNWVAKECGIEVIYVPHDGGGFHFEYQLNSGKA